MDDNFDFKGRLLFTGQKMLPPAHPRCACAVEYIEIESPVFQPENMTEIETEVDAEEQKEFSSGEEAEEYFGKRPDRSLRRSDREEYDRQLDYFKTQSPYGKWSHQTTSQEETSITNYFVRAEDKVWKYCGNCFPGECVDAEYKPVYSDIKEFLKDTYGVKDGMQRTRPRIRCQDGFEMSVQAGSMLYSTPRFNLRDGEYTACEIGFPNREEELIKQYAEDPEDLTETVYAYVPVEVIDEVIKKHGGFERKEGKR